MNLSIVRIFMLLLWIFFFVWHAQAIGFNAGWGEGCKWPDDTMRPDFYIDCYLGGAYELSLIEGFV